MSGENPFYESLIDLLHTMLDVIDKHINYFFNSFDLKKMTARPCSIAAY